MLLRHGASPSMPDAHGVTPLHLAVSAASMPLVSLLVEAGADPLAPDAQGMSAAGEAGRAGDECSR